MCVAGEAGRLHPEDELTSVLTNIRLALGVERDHRKAARHRLDERQPETLITERQQDVRVAVPTGDAARRLIAVDDADAGIVGNVVAVAEASLDDQPRRRVRGKGALPGADAFQRVLALDDRPDHEGGEVLSRRSRLEGIDGGVDPFGDHLDWDGDAAGPTDARDETGRNDYQANLVEPGGPAIGKATAFPHRVHGDVIRAGPHLVEFGTKPAAVEDRRPRLGMGPGEQVAEFF